MGPDSPRAPTTDYAFLAAELDERDATAFVHVGTSADPDQRYLTRVDRPDVSVAFVYVDGDAVLCAPERVAERAERTFPGDVVYGPSDLRAETPGRRAAEVLAERGVGPDETVLVPQHLPHDAALFLEESGVDLASAEAVAEARVRKTDTEVACVRAVQRGARRAMGHVETVLAEADQTGRALHVAGERLTGERLRREANVALARAGLDAAGNTTIRVGGRSADPGTEVPVDAGETVVVDLAPRGPHGYHGALARTYVVDAEGGWERRAHLAVQRAQDAGLAELAEGAGVAASTVHTETVAEVAAYGFDTGLDADTGFTCPSGHGVGLARRERPALTEDVALEAGTVLTVEPEVYDPEEGHIRLCDLVVVTADGFEPLAKTPRSLVPERRE